mgnify:CR=1 FL=1
MTTQELQLFATEIGATLDFYPTRLTVKTSDCTVFVDAGMDRTMTKQKIARLFTDKIDAVFCPSEDLLILKERLDQVR